MRKNGLLTGCTVSGHDVYGDDENFSILCAAVSSAMQLTDGILHDGLGFPADITSVKPSEGAQNKISIRLPQQGEMEMLREEHPELTPVLFSNVLNGLLLHFEALAEDFDGQFVVSVSAKK